MLQTQTVNTATLGLLKQLMALEALTDFNLVGGTALALQLGHRFSVDLDFFTFKKFKRNEIKSKIEAFAIKNKYEFEWDVIEDFTLIGNINQIKVDIIFYPYKPIDDLVIENDMRLLSTKDIAPMKLSAISQRGSKKDFYDMYELLKLYSLDEMFDFYKEKYPHTDITFILRSLTYFEDAEIQDNPISIKNYDWKDVKQKMKITVKRFINDKIDDIRYYLCKILNPVFYLIFNLGYLSKFLILNLK